jgi:hypothetical protein
MVSWIRSQLDPLHVQQINPKGKKCAGESDRQKEPQSGFILEITSEIPATNEGEK